MADGFQDSCETLLFCSSPGECVSFGFLPRLEMLAVGVPVGGAMGVEKLLPIREHFNPVAFVRKRQGEEMDHHMVSFGGVPIPNFEALDIIKTKMHRSNCNVANLIGKYVDRVSSH